MSTWPTHLWVADEVLERLPQLHRRGFCVGSIAPDCNVENADWTVFTPPRQMTHFPQTISFSVGFFILHVLPKIYQTA